MVFIFNTGVRPSYDWQCLVSGDTKVKTQADKSVQIIFEIEAFPVGFKQSFRAEGATYREAETNAWRLYQEALKGQSPNPVLTT